MPGRSTVPHPGAALRAGFLEPHGISQYRVAVDIGVPPRRINEIVLEKRAITADTALRLALYFGNEPLYWLELQSRWDLAQAAERLGARLEAEVRPRSFTHQKPKPPVKQQPRAHRARPSPAPVDEPERIEPGSDWGGLDDHLL